MAQIVLGGLELLTLVESTRILVRRTAAIKTKTLVALKHEPSEPALERNVPVGWNAEPDCRSLPPLH